MIGLGNGFTIKDGKALLIGGGLGTPPLYNLGKKLAAKGIEITTVLGFGSAKMFFIKKNLLNFLMFLSQQWMAAPEQKERLLM